MTYTRIQFDLTEPFCRYKQLLPFYVNNMSNSQYNDTYDWML